MRLGTGSGAGVSIFVRVRGQRTLTDVIREALRLFGLLSTIRLGW